MQIGEVAKRSSLTVDAIPILREAQALAQGGPQRRWVADCTERAPSSDFTSSGKCRDSASQLREVGELIQLRERKVDACESVKELLRAKLIDVRAKLQELRHLESELNWICESVTAN